MLPHYQRLTSSREYHRIYKTGKKTFSAHLHLFYESSNQNPSRFGFVVSQKQIAKIVARNRLKRILRAQIRELMPFIAPGFNVIIQAKSPLLQLTSEKIYQELIKILQKANLIQKW